MADRNEDGKIVHKGVEVGEEVIVTGGFWAHGFERNSVVKICQIDNDYYNEHVGYICVSTTQFDSRGEKLMQHLFADDFTRKQDA